MTFQRFRNYCALFLAFCSLIALPAIHKWPLWSYFPHAYACFSVGLLTAAYLDHNPRLFLKSQCGQLTPISWLLLGPYLVLNALVFRIYCLTPGKNAYVEVSPNLYLGRKLTAREAIGEVPSQWVSVLDLAVEFSEVAPFRKLPGYRSLPLLDATAPTIEQLRDTVAWISDAQLRGPVYVHCALGHGRSACIVAAYLIAIQADETIDGAITRLQQVRSGVRLNRDQTAAVTEYFNELKHIK